MIMPKRKASEHDREDCPFLDTVTRGVLVFDFEKVCSVTLSSVNVYACLVCGKYFQGRGLNTEAYRHSVKANHHLFINLSSKKIFCLPDGYEVRDASLADIVENLDPTYSEKKILDLDLLSKQHRALDGIEFTPGYLGLNNLGKTDGIAVVLHIVSKLRVFRNFFLLKENTDGKGPLVEEFGLFVRRMWLRNSFREQMSPHTVAQLMSKLSNGLVKVGEKTSPEMFLTWFLRELHRSLGKKSPIMKTVRGKVCVATKPKSNREDFGNAVIESKPFLFLTLDIPSTPSFKDAQVEEAVIPQLPLLELLNKYDGKTETTVIRTGERQNFTIESLPQVLILSLKRFEWNNFYWEKNRSIVLFPVSGLDMAPYSSLHSSPKVLYDLVARVAHEGDPDTGFFKVACANTADSSQWLEMHDLEVKPVVRHTLSAADACLLVYERRKV